MAGAPVLGIWETKDPVSGRPSHLPTSPTCTWMAYMDTPGWLLNMAQSSVLFHRIRYIYIQSNTSPGDAESGIVPGAIITQQKQVSGRQRLTTITFTDLAYMVAYMDDRVNTPGWLLSWLTDLYCFTESNTSTSQVTPAPSNADSDTAQGV